KTVSFQNAKGIGKGDPDRAHNGGVNQPGGATDAWKWKVRQAAVCRCHANAGCHAASRNSAYAARRSSKVSTTSARASFSPAHQSGHACFFAASRNGERRSGSSVLPSTV